MESPTSTSAAILLALRRGPGSGLDILERLSSKRKATVPPSQGSLYPALHALERRGLIDRLGPREGGGRGRAPIDYELTLRGVYESDRIREAFFGLLDSGPPPRLELDEGMQARVEESAHLSAFALELGAALRGGLR